MEGKELERGVGGTLSSELENPRNGGGTKKDKIIVIMGPTGSGKSKLAIDLAGHFPIEIINADSMQVYNGLDVLTNKVSLIDQKGNVFLSLFIKLFSLQFDRILFMLQKFRTIF